jgi:hypothetical protein
MFIKLKEAFLETYFQSLCQCCLCFWSELLGARKQSLQNIFSHGNSDYIGEGSHATYQELTSVTGGQTFLRNPTE